MTKPENGPVDRTVTGSEPIEETTRERGIGANEGEDLINSFELPFLFTTSTLLLLRPPMFFFHSSRIFRLRFKRYLKI